ncbi:MAG: type IV pilus secretin PilQ [bacterium]|nr:type IV pilus secretin PilQ [bacterium]
MGVPSKALTLSVIAGILTSCSAANSSPDVTNYSPTAEASEMSSGSIPGESTPAAELSKATEMQQSPQAGEAESKIQLSSIELINEDSDAAMVALSMTEETGFVLRRSAPTEYTLEIPAAGMTSGAANPLVIPQGQGVIRSARAVRDGSNLQVRMFVEEGAELSASMRGNTIYVQSASTQTASSQDASALASGARAQLAEGEEVATAPATSAADDSGSGIRSNDGSKVYTGRLISLDLQDTDIDNALRIIAEVSNLNIIASDDVRGKVTLRLIDVPWDQALDVILRTNGLDQVSEGNVVRIAPVDKLRAEREALLEAKRAQENLEDLTVRYVRVSYARVTELQELVESVLTERGTVTADERTNQLIIKDIAKGHEEAVALISKLDLRTPQVLLETQIVEASKNIMRDLGFQWNYNYTASAETGNSTGLVFPNSVVADTGVDFSAGKQLMGLVLDSADGSRMLEANLTALEEEGRARVISRPQVATINNKQAEVKSVRTLRVKLPDSGLAVATGSGASSSGGGASAFEEIDVGITLTVTPQASPDYYVLMDVNAKSSNLDDAEASTVDGIPGTIEREATSTILVKSGQTFALGGVYKVKDSDNVSGVPFLKDIPFLGYLFRATSVDMEDEELIFFITPHIVEGSFDPSLM